MQVKKPVTKTKCKKKLCFAKETEKTLETQPVTKSELYLNSVGNQKVVIQLATRDYGNDLQAIHSIMVHSEYFNLPFIGDDDDFIVIQQTH